MLTLLTYITFVITSNVSKGETMKELESLRNEINLIDEKMANLFVERMKAVEQIANYKKQNGLPIFDNEREKVVLGQNACKVEDNVLREYYVSFLKEQMEISKKYQQRILSGMKVAYSGMEGAFAYLASKKLFSTSTLVGFDDFESAYKSVENGECDVCVLPIENSYNGEVGQVTELLFSGSLYVNNAIEFAVSQDLLAVNGARLEDITDVVSHPQALGQCDTFIKAHGFKTHEFDNTALSAKYVAELGNKNYGAIASSEAGEIFGLKVLQKNINQSRTNTTRFLVCSRVNNITSDEKNIRSILVFTVKNEAGTLLGAIEVFRKHNYNMISLRSRPRKDHLWQYYFYVEFEGNVNTKEGESLLNDLSISCDKIKVIGTYKPE